MRLAWIALLVACGSTPKPATPALARGTQRITVDGKQVAIDVRGTGPVCIAHPGGPGMDSTYLHSAALEKQLTIIYIDPLGTGASDKLPAAEPYSIQRDAAVIEGVRAYLGLDRVCVVGHSYGGFVAQQYAVDHPTHVSGMFLYSTSPTTEPEWEKEVAASVKTFEKQPWYADATQAFAEEGNAKTDAELAAIVKRIVPIYFADWVGHRSEYTALVNQLRISYEVYRRRPEGKNGRFDVRRKLGTLRNTPAVIVTGDRDFSCGVNVSTWIAQGIAGSKLIVVEGAGHFAHIEQPGAFAAAVETFAAMLR